MAESQKRFTTEEEFEIYNKKMNGVRTKDILEEYGINSMLLSRIVKRCKKLNGNESNIKKSNIKKGSSKCSSDIKNIDKNISKTIANSTKSTVDKNTVAEIYSLAFQSCLELLQMRFGNQFNINAQETQKTQPEAKSDTVGWDKWEPSKIIHTENGTEIIMNGKRYTKAEYLSRYTDEEIELYKNLFVNDDNNKENVNKENVNKENVNNDDNDDVAQEPLTQEPVVEEKPETPTNEPPNSEPPKDETAEKRHEELIEHQKDANPEWADLITDIEKSKFDVDEDGFCALKTKKW